MTKPGTTERIRILFLSANPWTTSRILVDEEEREVFEKLQEGPDRDRFELHRHAAIRPIDLQRLLMLHEPHIVHFSAHGSKKQKIILGGKPGRGKQVDRDGLVQVFALYKRHVRLVVLNACFTMTQAGSLSEVIDYSIGAGKGIGDKEGVAFAGALYRALGFGKSIKEAFESAKAELALTRMPRTKGLVLFVRDGVDETDSFPKANCDLSNQGSDSGSHGFSLFTNLPSDSDLRQHESLLHQKERIDRAKPKISTFETLATSSSELVHRADCQNWACAQTNLSSMRKEIHEPGSGLMRLGDDLSRSPLTSLRKIKRAGRTKPNSIQNAMDQRSSSSSSHLYTTLTISVFKVALSECKCMQTPARRKDLAGQTRAGLAAKSLRRRARSESGRPD